jgi:hypothetical protein
LEIEAYKAEEAARPALETQQAQTSAPFYIEADKPRPLFPLALEAQRVHLTQELFPTSVPFDIEADKARVLVSPSPAAGQARASAPFGIEADKTLALIPFAPEAQRIHLPPALSPTLAPFDIEAGKAQASVSPAPEAGQVQLSAPFYIEVDKTQSSAPFAVAAQAAPLSWRLSSAEAWEVPSSQEQLQASVLHAVEPCRAQALV